MGTMKVCLLVVALAVLPACASVSPLHPRIYVRDDHATIGAGLTVSQLRARLSNPSYSTWRAPLTRNGASAAVERAARYLEQSSPADLAAVAELLTTRTFSYEKNDVSGFLAGAEMAIAFDWVYHALTPEQRAAALANIVTTADSSRKFLLSGGPDINHNYTYMALNAVAVSGLVLSGEPEPYATTAREYLALAKRFLEGPGMVLDTWNARQGAWAEGSHYTFHETLRTLILTLHAYRSATNADYFPQIHQNYGDFVTKAGLFLIACTRPDMTLERTGDISASRAAAALTVPLTVEMLAAGAGSPAAAAQLRSFSRALQTAYGPQALWPEFNWGMRIFFDPRASLAPPYSTLPLFQRLGPGTYDQFTLRSGWTADSSMVTILAGDQYTDHQHLDKGHFLLYHHAGLAVDSGTYSGMYQPGRHANEYAPRTLAHNALLIYDPAQTLPPGYTNDGGQSILRNKQHHSDWPTYLAHQHSEGLDTADVQASDLASTRYAYVRVNLTNAYPGRAGHYDRQFVYLPAADLLLVYDRVTSTNATFSKRWLLHFQDQPSVDGRAAKTGVEDFPNATLTTVRHRGDWQPGGPPVHYDGSLSVQSLLPAQRTITTIGGEGFEYFNNFTGQNYPAGPTRENTALREPGAWRMEVAPAEPTASDLFLNVLHFPNDPATPPPAAALIRPTAGQAAGAHIPGPQHDNAILFSASPSGAAISLPLEYTLNSPSPATHLITQLEPSTAVLIHINGRPPLRRAANPQGVLEFEDSLRGARSIRITAAP
jgi:hypothetical protein